MGKETTLHDYRSHKTSPLTPTPISRPRYARLSTRATRSLARAGVGGGRLAIMGKPVLLPARHARRLVIGRPALVGISLPPLPLRYYTLPSWSLERPPSPVGRTQENATRRALPPVTHCFNSILTALMHSQSKASKAPLLPFELNACDRTRGRSTPTLPNIG